MSVDPGARLCRAEGHKWDQIPNTTRPTFGYLITWRCESCHSIRKYILNVYGDVEARYYEHSDAFANTKGVFDNRSAARKAAYRLNARNVK